MLANLSKQSTNRISLYLALAVILAIGLWLRWRFIQTVYLYPDEFATLLAVRMIGQKGLPVMPSGLFYEHGLLFSYLGSLASFLGPARLAARYASLLCGGLTLLFTFWVGWRWFSPGVGLIAAAGLAIAPAAIHWSGRARMYALLQLLVLLTLWLAYEGIVQNKGRWRRAALCAFLGATLTHFVSVTLAPPLVLAAVMLWQRRSCAGERGRRGAGEQGSDTSFTRAGMQGSKGAEEQGSRGAREQSPLPPCPPAPLPLLSLHTPAPLPPRTPAFLQWQLWFETIALAGIVANAFFIKRAGQPKGIEALEGSAGQALTCLVEVFNIYSDFSFNLLDGWQAIAPFYLTLPALIFTPFALIAILQNVWFLLNPKSKIQNPKSKIPPALFLSVILLVTTLEMILLTSPDRRDDKYLFMLLPVLLLLGARGMAVVGKWLLVNSYWLLHKPNYQLPITNYQLPITNYQLPITNLLPLLISALLIIPAWPAAQSLLSNTGDDYASAFAYVQEHWQEGDTVLTGTPTAAALYLGRNDFYSVQRRGRYDYRILTVNGQAVDRWLASPVIRTEAALHQTLANHNVWLVLERWGLQREYYDLPFQQQLLAQTDYVTESQGIFVLRSKPNPQPIALDPARPVEANFGELVQLIGYTVEPEHAAPGQSLRLTLYWQALASMPDDYTVFVHLRDSSGGNIAQADHRPLGSVYPTTLWPVNQTIRETSDLPLPPDLAPENYDLRAGLYLLETGQRLPVQNDTSGENAVQLGVLSIGE